MSKNLKNNPWSAAERYALLGFPDKYRVLLTGGGYREAEIHLEEWKPKYSRYRRRYLGHAWVRTRTAQVPGGSYWQDEDADHVARAWLFEIARSERLRDVPPPDWWTGGPLRGMDEIAPLEEEDVDSP